MTSAPIQTEAVLSSTRKILLTGASGYLGQHFLKVFQQQQNVTKTRQKTILYALYRSADGFEEAVLQSECCNDANEIQLHKVDIANETQVKHFMESNVDSSFDLCLHLAAMASPKACHEAPELARSINIPSHFFQCLKEYNVPIVALSTDQVYCGTKAPYTDEDMPQPVNVYAQTKADMETLLLGTSESSHHPVICLRSSIILGPLGPYGCNVHSTFLHFCNSRNGVKDPTTFYTDEIRSVIGVKDVVNILCYFMNDHAFDNKSVSSCSERRRNAQRVYNMGGPKGVSRMEMALAVAKDQSFSSENFIPAQKADLVVSSDNSGTVRSPLNITMNSSQLEQLVGFKFQGLEEIVKATFANTSSSST